MTRGFLNPPPRVVQLTGRKKRYWDPAPWEMVGYGGVGQAASWNQPVAKTGKKATLASFFYKKIFDRKIFSVQLHQLYFSRPPPRGGFAVWRFAVFNLQSWLNDPNPDGFGKVAIRIKKGCS